MARSLSTIADNLTEGLHKHKAKDCQSNLDYVRANDSIITLKYGKCKSFDKKFNKNLIKRFVNRYRFCSEVMNDFCFIF